MRKWQKEKKDRGKEINSSQCKEGLELVGACIRVNNWESECACVLAVGVWVLIVRVCMGAHLHVCMSTWVHGCVCVCDVRVVWESDGVRERPRESLSELSSFKVFEVFSWFQTRPCPTFVIIFYSHDKVRKRSQCRIIFGKVILLRCNIITTLHCRISVLKISMLVFANTASMPKYFSVDLNDQQFIFFE